MPVIYFMGQIDFQEEMNVFILRAIFVTVHLGIAAMIGVLYQMIRKTNNRTPVNQQLVYYCRKLVIKF